MSARYAVSRPLASGRRVVADGCGARGAGGAVGRGRPPWSAHSLAQACARVARPQIWRLRPGRGGQRRAGGREGRPVGFDKVSGPRGGGRRWGAVTPFLVGHATPTPPPSDRMRVGVGEGSVERGAGRQETALQGRASRAGERARGNTHTHLPGRGARTDLGARAVTMGRPVVRRENMVVSGEDARGERQEKTSDRDERVDFGENFRHDTKAYTHPHPLSFGGARAAHPPPHPPAPPSGAQACSLPSLRAWPLVCAWACGQRRAAPRALSPRAMGARHPPPLPAAAPPPAPCRARRALSHPAAGRAGRGRRRRTATAARPPLRPATLQRRPPPAACARPRQPPRT